MRACSFIWAMCSWLRIARWSIRQMLPQHSWNLTSSFCDSSYTVSAIHVYLLCIKFSKVAKVSVIEWLGREENGCRGRSDAA